MEFDLLKLAREKLIIAAHRGVAGGNIPCNTMESYEAALLQGADMLEIDIARSSDGVLYTFHPGMEPVHLYSSRSIFNMESREVDMLPLVNQDRTPTQYHVPRLRDVLDRFKGRCYINVDKFWMWPDEIAKEIRDRGMQDQVLVKTDAKREIFDVIEDVAYDMPYMTIAHERDDVTEELARRKMRYVGVEALFTSDDAEICSREYIARMHDKGLLVWANAIIYYYKAVLSAGHTDDISVTGNPDDGWGWLADRGFDIIQTDWPLACINYLNSR